MAFITNGITNWIGGYVDSVVGGALKAGGGFAGDAVGSVGNGINNFGGGVEKSIRRYGDGIKDYGNAIKDWTDADGPRTTTAANPLGLSSNITGGKRALGWPKASPASANSSPAYRDPSSVGTRAAVKPSAAAATRALPAAKKKVGGVTNIPIGAKSSPAKVPIAGTSVNKTKAVTGAAKTPAVKPSNGSAAKRVPMAGVTIKKDQALTKKMK